MPSQPVTRDEYVDRILTGDLGGLRLLRDRLGDRFMAGYLLNLGELAYRKEERIMVMPLSELWSLTTRLDVASSPRLTWVNFC